MEIPEYHQPKSCRKPGLQVNDPVYAIGVPRDGEYAMKWGPNPNIMEAMDQVGDDGDFIVRFDELNHAEDVMEWDSTTSMWKKTGFCPKHFGFSLALQCKESNKIIYVYSDNFTTSPSGLPIRELLSSAVELNYDHEKADLVVIHSYIAQPDESHVIGIFDPSRPAWTMK